MIGWNNEIEIDINAKSAFEAVIDLSQTQQWIKKIEHIEPLFEGRLTAGDQWLETRKEGKRRHKMLITAFEVSEPDAVPPFIHCAGAIVSNMKSYYRFIFEPIDPEHCKVRIEARVETSNFFKKLLSRLMIKMMKTAESDLLENLKIYLENKNH